MERVWKEKEGGKEERRRHQSEVLKGRWTTAQRQVDNKKDAGAPSRTARQEASESLAR
jgi:hypothetical protein